MDEHYLTAGESAPEVALSHPETLIRRHKDFQHVGSDVMQAFTDNTHPEKLRIVDKEDKLAELNRNKSGNAVYAAAIDRRTIVCIASL